MLVLALPIAHARPMRAIQKDLAKLERKYEEQKDPVHQAKALAKLLPIEVDAAAMRIKAGEVEEGIARLERYRDAAEQLYQALLATGRNPVKKPDGFLQLQIGLRETVRRLRDVADLVPYAQRDAVEAVRADLETLNVKLLQQLFPPPKPKPPKKKGGP